MRKVFYFGFLGCIVSMMGASCTSGNKPAAEIEILDKDSISISEEVENSVGKDDKINLFDKWFEEFQEANPHWTRTTEGHKKLTNAFKKEMTSNLEFAKSVCMDKVFTSDCISSYDRKDGEHGGIWSFVFRKTVTLRNPLYNGQTEVYLAYEIFSTIPATASHEHPYLENVNNSNTFNPYHDINYSGTLNLGSYIVTKKDN